MSAPSSSSSSLYSMLGIDAATLKRGDGSERWWSLSRFAASTMFVIASALWLAHQLVKYRRITSKIKGQPGATLLLAPFRIFSEIMPNIPYVNYNLNTGSWFEKYQLNERIGASVFYWRGLFAPSASLVVGDAVATKKIFTEKNVFVKPTEDYAVLSFLGSNVLITEGQEWRRHRRLTAPSFSEKNNRLVWGETVRITEEWLEVLGLKKEDDMLDEDTVHSTLRLTLMIISAAAFGQRFSWPRPGSSDSVPKGRRLTFIGALQGAMEGVLIKFLFPEWAYKLPFQRPRRVQLCYQELQGHLEDMILARRADKAEGGDDRDDLFSALLSGVDDDEGQAVLTNEELIGNMFIFILAGHETTAHTMAFLLTLLAIYPEHQDKLYEEAKTVLGDRESTFDDYSSLTYALAVFHEALRMYSPVMLIPKITTEDTTLPAHTAPKPGSGAKPEPIEVFVPRNTRVGIISTSCHFNPQYWGEDADEFRPSRFVDTPDYRWNRDALVAFSGGPRQCLGQRFALVEVVAILSTIFRNYTTEIPSSRVQEYALRVGETTRQRLDRILRPVSKITLTPGDPLPLVFRRRPSEA